MNRLQDRTAIIWGGAGSIGTATARRFAEEGATVYLAGRTEATLKDAAAATRAAGYGAATRRSREGSGGQNRMVQIPGREAPPIHLARKVPASRMRGSFMIDLTEIGTLTICSSSKFYGTAQGLAKELADAGITVYTPRFDFNEEVVEVTKDDKMQLTHEFLGKIDRSDAIYVIDQDGYTGRSVCIEIGYASALGKTVLLSEPPAENAVKALTSEIIAVGDITRRIKP